MLEAELSRGSRNRGRPRPETHQSCDTATRFRNSQMHDLSSASVLSPHFTDGFRGQKRPMHEATQQ